MASIRDNDLLDKWLLCEFGVDQQTYRDALEEIQELRDAAAGHDDKVAEELKALRLRVVKLRGAIERRQVKLAALAEDGEPEKALDALSEGLDGTAETLGLDIED